MTLTQIAIRGGRPPVDVNCQVSATVTNNGPDTVYYGAQNVTSADAVGSIAADGSVTLVGTQYFTVAPTAVSASLSIDSLSGGSSLPPLRVPFAFDTADLLTGITVYTPTPGDYLIPIVTISVLSTWDGTTPTWHLHFDGGSDLDFGSLEDDPNADADGHLLAPYTNLLADLSVSFSLNPMTPLRFADTTPLLLHVDDSAAGDPNDPTPMSMGSAEIVFLVVPAA